MKTLTKIQGNLRKPQKALVTKLKAGVFATGMRVA